MTTLRSLALCLCLAASIASTAQAQMPPLPPPAVRGVPPGGQAVVEPTPTGPVVDGRLSALPYSDAREPITLPAIAGLAGLVLFWSAWLAITRSRRPTKIGTPPPEPRAWSVMSPVLAVVLAIGASWPAAISGTSRMVGREFDLPGTIWFLSAAPRLLGAPLDPLTGFPDTADYGRADSFVWLITGWLLQFINPVLLNNIAQVVAPALSCWAAEVAARRLGARAPWSLVAGIGYAFAGPTATALLEGHTYLAVNPFLPLALWGAVALGSPEADRRHGIVFGLAWAGALWSSVYLGFCATLIGAWFGAPALLQRRLKPAPTVVAGAIVLGAGLPYVWLFLQGGASLRPSGETLESWIQRLDFVQRGSGGVLSLLPPSPELDAFYHAMSLYPLFSVTALAMVAPRVLRGDRAYGSLLALAGFAAMIAVGPLIRYAYVGQFYTPLALLYLLPGAEAMRFPMRFGWVMTLSLGVVAARVLTRLSKAPAFQPTPRSPSPLHFIWLVLAIDLVVALGLPRRQRWMPAAPNDALATATGPILDVYPRLRLHQDDLNAWFQANDCLLQHGHGQAIADHCASRFAADNPRLQLQEDLARAVRDGGFPLRTLDRLGFAHVALHADLLTAEELAQWQAVLAERDPTPVDGRAGGERILLYDLAPAP